MWRTTHDEAWRERAWNIFLSLEKHTRTPVGHASLVNVDVEEAAQMDDSPSYALAETWKYMYLIFLDEDPLPPSKYVFNTEAHPLPIFRWSLDEQTRFRVH